MNLILGGRKKNSICQLFAFCQFLGNVGNKTENDVRLFVEFFQFIHYNFRIVNFLPSRFDDCGKSCLNYDSFRPEMTTTRQKRDVRLSGGPFALDFGAWFSMKSSIQFKRKIFLPRTEIDDYFGFSTTIVEDYFLIAARKIYTLRKTMPCCVRDLNDIYMIILRSCSQHTNGDYSIATQQFPHDKVPRTAAVSKNDNQRTTDDKF